MKSINIQISDERWLGLQARADKWGISIEELLSRVVEKVAHDPHKPFLPGQPKKRVFIDTNVLALIVGNTSLGKFVIKHLEDSGIEAITFSKCVYELYSLLKGTTSDRRDKKLRNNHPLKDFLQPQINDIGQKLFKNTDIDHKANTYYWFNLCEEWMWSDYIQKYCVQSGQEEAREMLALQKDFVDWKIALKQAFSEVNQKISDNFCIPILSKRTKE